MPEELANLLIRISAEGFQDVIDQLDQLEQRLASVGSSDGLRRIIQLLNAIEQNTNSTVNRVSELGNKMEELGKRMNGQSSAQEEAEKKNKGFLKSIEALQRAFEAYYLIVQAPRKFLSFINNTVRANQQLVNMAINANMAKASLMALGNSLARFGGSEHDAAQFGAMVQNSMQGLRMGQGGGAVEQAAQMYGVNVYGSAWGGLATQEEFMRNVAAALEAHSGDNDYQLGLKQTLNLPEPMFQMLRRGVKAYDEDLAARKEYTERLKKLKVEESMERWGESAKKLENEFLILKSKILRELEPVISQLAVWLKDFVNFLSENPIIVKLIAYGMAISTATAVMVGIGRAGSIVIAAFKAIGAAKAASTAANAASTAASTASSASRAAGAVAGGPFAVIDAAANVLNLLATAEQIDNDSTIAKGLGNRLDKINEKITKFHNSYLVFTSISNRAMDPKRAYAHLERWGINRAIVDAAVNARDAGRVPGGENRQSGETTINVGPVTVTVSSEKASPTDVAEEVKRAIETQVFDAVRDAWTPYR